MTDNFSTNDFLTAVWMLFRKTPATDEILKNAAEKEELKDFFSRIRCPLCSWKPQKSSRWCCADAPENSFSGCYTSWNTFDTGGICPGCNYRWQYTTCLACHRNSLHQNWYIDS